MYISLFSKLLQDFDYVYNYRGVAQLVEHRSPKPGVEGSIPFAPATYSSLQFYTHNLFINLSN